MARHKQAPTKSIDLHTTYALPVSSSIIRGRFDVPGVSRELLVFEPYRFDERELGTSILHLQPQAPITWGAVILGRMQGLHGKYGAVNYANRLFESPGISIASYGMGTLAAAAFTDIEQHPRRSGSSEYTFKQAGVVWRHTDEDPHAVAPDIYHDALAGAMFCNVVDLDPAATVYVRGYAGDTRSKERFLGRRAGFEPAPGPEWGVDGARLQSTCGVVAQTLLANYPFLERNLARGAGEAPTA